MVSEGCICHLQKTQERNVIKVKSYKEFDTALRIKLCLLYKEQRRLLVEVNDHSYKLLKVLYIDQLYFSLLRTGAINTSLVKGDNIGEFTNF